MRFTLLPLATLVLAALMPVAPAQTRVMDVGLTMDLGPTLPAFVGYSCGAFSCQAFAGSPFQRGSVRTFTVFGAPRTPYVLAVGTRGRCVAFPGVGNALLLGTPAITLQIGATGAVVPGLRCNQGQDVFRFTMPRTAPPGLQIRFQGAGVSNSGMLAFGPAIDSSIL